MPLSDSLSVVRKATAVFEKAGIRYFIGGSLASSLWGIPRATQDVDIVADISESDLKKNLRDLSETFFIDEAMALDAIKRRSSFNIIDKETIYKLDIFIAGSGDLAAEEMRRRIRFKLAEPDDQSLFVCSAEDIIAHKLYWYKLGDGVSDRQWNDALNVVKIQRERLDLEYLRRVCDARGIPDLLEKLLSPE